MLGVLAALCIFVGEASGEGAKPSAREYKIKAAYIYNFLRYIEWPSRAFENTKSPFVVGVLGDVIGEWIVIERLRLGRFECLRMILLCLIVALSRLGSIERRFGSEGVGFGVGMGSVVEGVLRRVLNVSVAETGLLVLLIRGSEGVARRCAGHFGLEL